MSVTLYKIDGTEIEVGGGDTPEPTPISAIAVAAKAKKAHGARTNIVQTHGYDPNYSGDIRWMESGLLFKRTKPKTSFTFTWKITITGEATEVRIDCKGSDVVYASHEYAGESRHIPTPSATQRSSILITFHSTLRLQRQQTQIIRLALALRER